MQSQVWYTICKEILKKEKQEEYLYVLTCEFENLNENHYGYKK